MIVYMDADRARDLATKRSIAGILLMLNNTPIRLVSRRQKTEETSTYGSESVTSRIATELIIEGRPISRSLSADLDMPTLILGDDMLVV
jgi:hypothetical protein